jgi:hypothetical protein
MFRRGPDSVVGIATGYGLDGPGIESRWGARYFAPVQTGPGTHPASCTMGTGSFPRVKSGRSVTLTPHPLLVPWLRKGRAIPLLPYGPYGLYRASVPVQGCTLPYLMFRFFLFWKNLIKIFKFYKNLSGIKGTSHEDLCTFIIISRWITISSRSVSDKRCRGNQNTHFGYCNFMPKILPFMR